MPTFDRTFDFFRIAPLGDPIPTDGPDFYERLEAEQEAAELEAAQGRPVAIWSSLEDRTVAILYAGELYELTIRRPGAGQRKEPA